MDSKSLVFKRLLGVSLLEIMLLLGIAAGIIIMSVRYYQTAMINREANGALSLVQAVVSAADSLSVGTDSYEDNVTTEKLESILKASGMRTPWNTKLEVEYAEPHSYVIKFPDISGKTCVVLKSKMAGDKQTDTSPTGCPREGRVDFVYIYNKYPQEELE